MLSSDFTPLSAEVIGLGDGVAPRKAGDSVFAAASSEAEESGMGDLTGAVASAAFSAAGEGIGGGMG